MELLKDILCKVKKLEYVVNHTDNLKETKQKTKRLAGGTPA